MDDWREALPEELQKEKSLEFDHKEEDLIQVPVQVVKMLVDTKKMLGNSIQIPGKEAKPEDLAKFFVRLGAPDSAEGYELKLPDGAPEGYTEAFGEVIKEAMEWFKPFAKELGLTKAQGEKLFTTYMARDLENYTKAQESYDTGRKTAEDALKKEWGNKYDENLALAKRAYRVFIPEGSEIEKTVFNDKALGDDPHIVKVFHGIASQIGEDRLPSEAPPKGEIKLTKEKLIEMERDPRYDDPSQRDAEYVKYVDGLWEQLYPGEVKLAPTDRGETT